MRGGVIYFFFILFSNKFGKSKHLSCPGCHPVTKSVKVKILLAEVDRIIKMLDIFCVFRSESHCHSILYDEDRNCFFFKFYIIFVILFLFFHEVDLQNIV